MKANQWSGIQGEVSQRRRDQTGVCVGGRVGLHSSRETMGKVKVGGAVVRGRRGWGWRLEPKVGSAWNKPSESKMESRYFGVCPPFHQEGSLGEE